jgi:pentatricopeptide repeat protein
MQAKWTINVFTRPHLVRYLPSRYYTTSPNLTHIYGLIKQDKIDDASLEFLELIANQGFEPQPRHFKPFLQAFQKSSRTKDVHKWLRLMIKKFNGTPLVSQQTFLLKWLVKFDKVKEAHNLFKVINPKHVGVYNIMIFCYSVRKHMQNAQTMFDDMLKEDITPNVATFVYMIRGYARVNNMEKALEMYIKSNEYDFKLEDVVHKWFLRVVIEKGQVKSALHLFDSLSNRTFELIVMMTNKLIKRKMFDEAENTIKKHAEEMTPEQYDTLYRKITIVRRLEKKPSITQINKEIALFCRENKVEEAISIFKEAINAGIKPDQFTFAHIINTYANLNSVDDVEIWLHDMEHVYEVEPSQHIKTKVLGLYCRLSIEKARQCFDTIKKKDFVTYYTMISAYVKKIDENNGTEYMKKAKDVFDAMINNHIEPEVPVLRIMIQGYAKIKDEETAINMYYEITKYYNIQPCLFLDKELLKAHMAVRNLQSALKLWETMEKDQYVFRMMINWLFRIGDIGEAKRVLDQEKEFLKAPAKNTSIKAEEL